MNKNTILHVIFWVFISIIILTVLMLVLPGKNGIINKEKEKYNKTHTEQIQEKQENKSIHKTY